MIDSFLIPFSFVFTSGKYQTSSSQALLTDPGPKHTKVLPVAPEDLPSH